MKKTEIAIAISLFTAMSVFAAPMITGLTVTTSETTLFNAVGRPNKNVAFTVCNFSTNTNSIFVKWCSATNAVTLTNGVEVPPGSTLSATATTGANPAGNTVTAIAPANTQISVQTDDAR